MGKRTNYPRVPRDFYATPYKAVLPLLPFLKPHTRFSEPCCGDMALVKHLEKHGHKLYWASDIENRVMVGDVGYTVAEIDAMTLTTPLAMSDCVITNPPYKKETLFPMIEHFRNLSPAWLLLNADFAHNIGSSPYLKYCSHIISVGRIIWIKDTKNGGMENFAWYKFEMNECETRFVGRS